MYLSRMELNIKERNTMKALVSPNLFHGAIEDAFPGPRERKLWRIDRLGGNYYLLLLSPEQPQLHRAAAQFGFPDSVSPWETKDYGASGLRQIPPKPARMRPEAGARSMPT